MSSFMYKNQADMTYEHIEKVIQTLEKQNNPEIDKILSDYQTFLYDKTGNPSLTISFIGQYNAGKSSTIAALTGADYITTKVETVEGEQKVVEEYQLDRKKLYVGAQIMTDQIQEYSWENVRIIDTPGIGAGRTKHDQMSHEQISKSDLLVFVLSNELFNQFGGEFFQSLVNDSQRKGQVALVINKMSRESGERQALLHSIKEVLHPHDPSEFYLSYIDARYYLQAQSEEDEEEIEYLQNKSNFSEFTHQLQRLIERNGINTKLTTPLHQTVEILEKSINSLSTDDKLERNLLEILRRQSKIIEMSKSRFQILANGEIHKLEHKIIMLGEDVAAMADGNHTSEDVNNSIYEAQASIRNFINNTIDALQRALEEELKRLEDELKELKDSTLSRSITAAIQSQVQKKNVISEKNIAVKQKSVELEKGLFVMEKVGQFAQDVKKETVVDIVKFFGGKFKPWGAKKLTNLINKLGPAMVIIGSVLEIFIATKEEYDEKQQLLKLRTVREEIRKEFREVAEEVRSDYEQMIGAEVLSQFSDEIEVIRKQKEEIQSSSGIKQEGTSELNVLLKDTKNLINIIVKS